MFGTMSHTVVDTSAGGTQQNTVETRTTWLLMQRLACLQIVHEDPHVPKQTAVGCWAFPR